MTLQHFLKTLVIGSVGFIVLSINCEAGAEGGEGASLVTPDAYSEAKEATENTTGSISVKPAASATKGKAGTADKSPIQATIDADNAISTSKLPSRSRLTDALQGGALKPLITRYALQHNIPYGLADAVVRIESRYNAAARNGPNLGLTQVNFRTAQSLGYTGEASGLFDAETNLRYGLKYLSQAYQLAGGDMCGAIMRYQGGHRAQTMTSASRLYCAKVKTIMATAQ